jgi:hypothetical protein
MRKMGLEVFQWMVCTRIVITDGSRSARRKAGHVASRPAQHSANQHGLPIIALQTKAMLILIIEKICMEMFRLPGFFYLPVRMS